MNKTQTATITRSYQIGPQQMLHTVPAGATVRVWVGDGTSELVSIGHSRYTGAVRRSDLRFDA